MSVEHSGELPFCFFLLLYEEGLHRSKAQCEHASYDLGPFENFSLINKS